MEGRNAKRKPPRSPLSSTKVVVGSSFCHAPALAANAPARAERRREVEVVTRVVRIPAQVRFYRRRCEGGCLLERRIESRPGSRKVRNEVLGCS